MRKIFLLFTFLTTCFQGRADRYQRQLTVDVIHYEFHIALNDSTNNIEGTAIIKVRFTGVTDSVFFDLVNKRSEGTGMKVVTVSCNGNSIKSRHASDRLTLFPDRPFTINDSVDFSITYTGIPADGLIISANRYGRRVFFSDHWPDRAHNYLPCIDHPYDKASVDFYISAPRKYRVVANGSNEGEIMLPHNFRLTHWKESVPIPVKVMAFGAAEFAVAQNGNACGIPVSAWVFRSDSLNGTHDYSVAPGPLKYYCSLIGPFPFEKLADVQSKTIYGGMENAGCIFYAQNSVTGFGRDEGLMAHEIAHQWFGDCVTEKDWYHVWLSEGFATYLTSMYFEYKNGEESLKQEMSETRKMILKFYEKKKSPVIDTAETNLMELLNTNSYQKGAWVLHMLRNEIGDENFKKTLRLYFEKFRNSNALTKDFQKVAEEVSGKDLSDFFHQWLYIPGQPELKIWQQPGKKKKTTDLFIEQEQSQLFKFNIEFQVKGSEGEQRITVPVTGKLTHKTINTAKLAEIVPDPDVRLLFSLVQ